MRQRAPLGDREKRGKGAGHSSEKQRKERLAGKQRIDENIQNTKRKRLWIQE